MNLITIKSLHKNIKKQVDVLCLVVKWDSGKKSDVFEIIEWKKVNSVYESYKLVLTKDNFKLESAEFLVIN